MVLHNVLFLMIFSRPSILLGRQLTSTFRIFPRLFVCAIAMLSRLYMPRQHCAPRNCVSAYPSSRFWHTFPRKTFLRAGPHWFSASPASVRRQWSVWGLRRFPRRPRFAGELPMRRSHSLNQLGFSSTTRAAPFFLFRRASFAFYCLAISSVFLSEVVAHVHLPLPLPSLAPSLVLLSCARRRT